MAGDEPTGLPGGVCVYASAMRACEILLSKLPNHLN